MKIVFFFLAGILLGAILGLATRTGPVPEIPRERPPSPETAAPVRRADTAAVRKTPVAPLPLPEQTAEDAPPRPEEPFGPSPGDLFAAEKRDPSWASAFETVLRDRLERELEILRVKASVENLECRTSTCSFLVRASPIDVNELTSSSDLVWMGHTAEISGFDQDRADSMTVRFVLHYPEDIREPDAFEAFFAERRARALAWREERDGGP